MSLSAELCRRLYCHGPYEDEPLAKRLKLAENVFYSHELPIVAKEDLIINWLSSIVAQEKNPMVWSSINHCLSLDPIIFSRLTAGTKSVLIEQLISNLKGFPKQEISLEALKCCSYIFSNSSIHSYLHESGIISLLKSLINFVLLVTTEKFQLQQNIDSCAIECLTNAISSLSDISKKVFLGKENFTIIFIEKILFRLSKLIKSINEEKQYSKMVLAAQKCVKRLLLDHGKILTSSVEEDETDSKDREGEVYFLSLRNKMSKKCIEDVKITVSYVFQCASVTLNRNPITMHSVLVVLTKCGQTQDDVKQILTVLLESSSDITYNFDSKVNGITLELFLRTHLENILLQDGNYTQIDYELMSAISKVNPVLVEELVPKILERILFAFTKCEKVMTAKNNLIKDLWKVCVRLRRPEKFIANLLTALNNNKEKKIKFLKKCQLPHGFLNSFGEDLQRMTHSQVIAMLRSVLYHLQLSGLTDLENSGLTETVYITCKISIQILSKIFENAAFLEENLSHDSHCKLWKEIANFRNLLSSFVVNICSSESQLRCKLLIDIMNGVIIWCEIYSLLKLYFPNTVVNDDLNYPIEKSYLKQLKNIVRECQDTFCSYTFEKLLFFKLVYYEPNKKKLEKIQNISSLWPIVIENHFHNISYFNADQIAELISYFLEDIYSSQNSLNKWLSVISRNFHTMSSQFASVLVVKIITNIITTDVEMPCATKKIIEMINSEEVLKVLDDSKKLSKLVKKIVAKSSQQEFNQIKGPIDILKLKTNLLLLTQLPVLYLDKNIRILVYLVLFSFEQEMRNEKEILELVRSLYLDLLHQNDINVLEKMYDPLSTIKYFVNHKCIIGKILKLSMDNRNIVDVWHVFVESDSCSVEICSILLTVIDVCKTSNSYFHDKIAVAQLTKKLVDKILNQTGSCNINTYAVKGLTISLKHLLLEDLKIKEDFKLAIMETVNIAMKDNQESGNMEMINEVFQLGALILNNRAIFEVTEEFVKQLCFQLKNITCRRTRFLIVNAFSDDELKCLLHYVKAETVKCLINGDNEYLSKIIAIWDCFSTAEFSIKQINLINLTIVNIFKKIIKFELHEASVLGLLQMCVLIVSAKRMAAFENSIFDLIFVICNHSVKRSEEHSRLFSAEKILQISLLLLRKHTNFILDRLSILIGLLKKVIQIVLNESKFMNASNERRLRVLAIDIEKFFTFLATLKKPIARISPYLVADLLDMCSKVGVLPPFLKKSVESSVAYLFSNCDRHAISYLTRTLPLPIQEVFKLQYKNYLKFHKFSGRI